VALTFKLSPAVLLCLALACSKKEKPEARTEPWENPAFSAHASASTSASAGSPRAVAEKYVLERSEVTFTLPAKEQTTRGRVASVKGELSLDGSGFEAARATIDVDLTSLSIESDDDAGVHAAFTRRALEWLELGEQVAPHVRDRHQIAHFELKELERVTETKAGFQATAKGALSLHGFRVPVEQRIAFEIAQGSLTIRSVRSLAVKLAEHDLKPRNAQGQVVATELSLVPKRIGREVRVDFELTFAARPTDAKAD
jgi:polyisoprenoid-binding protein YceI